MDIKALREEFAQLHTEAGKLISTAAQDKRDLTAEEKENNDKRYARMDSIKSLVEQQNKHAAMKFDAGEIDKPEPKGKVEFEQKAQPQKFTAEEVHDRINKYLRTGDDRQLFAITTTTGTSVYLPKSVIQPVEVRRLNNAIRAALAAYGLSPIEGESTEQFVIPAPDDTANEGQTIAENVALETLADHAPTPIALNAVLYDSKAEWFSNTVVLANSFDILAFIMPRLQKRVDKKQEGDAVTKLITGTVGKTTAVNNAITYNELLDWEHSLLPEYRSDMVYLVSDSLYKLLRRLADSNGRPIMDLDPVNKFQTSIHGKPVLVCDKLAAVGTLAKPGVIASASSLFVRGRCTSAAHPLLQLPRQARPDRLRAVRKRRLRIPVRWRQGSG